MKNYKYLLLCFIIGIFSSCEEEVSHVNTVNLGANAILKDTKISLFDINENLKIKLLTNGVTFNKIEVIKQELVKDDGKMSKAGKQLYKKVEKKVGDAISKDKEASFNSAILALLFLKMER